MNTGNHFLTNISGNPLSLQSGLKRKKIESSMSRLYLNVGKEEQIRIVGELWQKIGLTSREMAKRLGWNRSSFFFYKDGTYRIPYNRLIDLCNLAGVDVSDRSLKFIEINNQPKGEKLDLSKVDEPIFQALKPVEWQKVVAVGVLTDGSLCRRKSDGKYMLRFSSSDKNLHAFFQKLVLVAFNEGPSGFGKTKDQNMWITSYQRSPKNPMIQKLLSFSATYSTKEDTKPFLNFLLDERNEVKIQALRFAMSCDGSVSIKKRSNGVKGYELKLACAHPALNAQWQALFHGIGLDMNMCRDKNVFSGIQGISSGKKESFQRFAEMGGFLPTNVKVTNGNYIGMEKNEVLKAIVERDVESLTKPF